MRFGSWRYMAALAAALLAFTSAPAWAQTYSPVANLEADIGIVVPAAASTTNFSFASSNGNVTKSGSGTRLSSGSTRTKITIGCTGNGQLCNDPIKVKIGSIGSTTGKAGSLTSFNVTSISGAISGSSGSNPRTFIIDPVNKSTDASFWVGATLPITSDASAGAFGAAESDFYVYVAKSPTNPTTGIISTVYAETYRGISVSGTQLKFGKVAKPTAAIGTTTVVLDPDDNTRTITGVSSPGGGYARSTFTITGENSMAITVTQSGSMTMTRSGGGGSIVVALSHTDFPTQLGSGSTGSEGTVTFHTGGSFNVTTSTATGSYSGSYTTTVSYN